MSQSADNSRSFPKSYDLVERTARFGEGIIRFVRMVPIDVVTEPLIKQLVRSATSIGANFTEANNASSQRDFRHKIGISRKEADETKYWLRMIAVATPQFAAESRLHWSEARQLHLILVSIFQNQTRIMKQLKNQPTPEA